MNKKLMWGVVIGVVVIVVVSFIANLVEVSKLPPIDSPITPDWKMYSDSSISFEYPSLLSVKKEGEIIKLTHSVPYKHANPCDFKGDAPPLDTVGDFGVSIQVVNKNLKELVQSTGYPGWEYVSANPYILGSLSGYKVLQGVEGCGNYTYYFTLSPSKTLVIQRGLNPELSLIIADYEMYRKLPGIITPDQEEKIFTKILSTFTFIPPSSLPSCANGATNPPHCNADLLMPVSVINSITPKSGPVGTVITLKGSNFAGFEGDLDAWIENSKGEVGFLHGLTTPPSDQGIVVVKIVTKPCQHNDTYVGSCIRDEYLTITPGVYKIFTAPWGKKSNSVEFTVTE